MNLWWFMKYFANRETMLTPTVKTGILSNDAAEYVAFKVCIVNDCQPPPHQILANLC